MARKPVLESAVMDILWDEGGWLTTVEVRRLLNRDVAPTTVGTVLTRLYEKGRLQRRERGKSFEYQASRTREEHVASHMEQVLDTSHDRGLALLEFVGRLPPDDRSKLRRLLRL